jgi:ribosome-binding factor A
LDANKSKNERGSKVFCTFTLMSGTVRQQKYSKLILKELSDIFLKEKFNILDNAFVTVADVKMSPDLSVATVYMSMTLAKDKNAVLAKINARKSEIRKALGNKIRNQARIVPQLNFFIDEIEENAQRIEDIIKNLNIPKEQK